MLISSKYDDFYCQKKMALDLHFLGNLRSVNIENMEIAVIYMQPLFCSVFSIKDPIIYNTLKENRRGIQMFAMIG